jgi:hypothetical protein
MGKLLEINLLNSKKERAKKKEKMKSLFFLIFKIMLN